MRIWPRPPSSAASRSFPSTKDLPGINRFTARFCRSVNGHRCRFMFRFRRISCLFRNTPLKLQWVRGSAANPPTELATIPESSCARFSIPCLRSNSPSFPPSADLRRYQQVSETSTRWARAIVMGVSPGVIDGSYPDTLVSNTGAEWANSDGTHGRKEIVALKYWT
jgi:hypothetical protein